MNKTLLLLTLSLACIMTQAQQIDTALIKGRWELYSLRNGNIISYRNGDIIEYLDSTCRRGDHIIYRDSCGIKVKGEFPQIETVTVPEDIDSISDDSLKDVNRPKARGDSTLKDINRPKARGDSIFKTFMEFDGRGHVTALIALNNDPGQESPEEKGEYMWTTDNKIIQKLGNGPPKTLTILHLTDSELDLLYDNNTVEVEMTFTRAK